MSRKNYLLLYKFLFRKFTFFHEKNSFVEVSKNLATYRSKVILLDHQSNYIEYLSIDDNAAKNFDVLATSLNELF